MPRAYEPIDTKNRVRWLFLFFAEDFQITKKCDRSKGEKKNGTEKKRTQSNGTYR